MTRCLEVLGEGGAVLEKDRLLGQWSELFGGL